MMHTPEYRNLTKVLFNARKKSGLTQTQVAEKLGKPQSYIAKIEGAERRIDIVEFIALARAMGFEPEALFAETLGALAAG